MKTYRFKSEQDTVTINVITDAVSNNQDNMTIHDIQYTDSTKKEGLERAGFYFRVPDVVTKKTLKDVAESVELDLDLYDETTDTYTSINAANALAFVTAALNNGTVGSFYSEELEVAHNIGEVDFSVLVGALPDGLEIYNNYIHGVPTVAGVFNFTVIGIDAAGQVIISGALSITVDAAVATTTAPATTT
jgi:hypothetical protein